jgi:hypothetical protein
MKKKPLDKHTQAVFDRFPVYQKLYANEPPSIPFVRCEDLESYMGKREYKAWDKWAMGSTRYEEGFYIHDVADFLAGRPNLD